ncbi:MAG: TlpA disulfide reductase family protein [Flavobacterium sp.]|uniref:TlpA disulfide reductase family protein n=1 Tax=Flavobacterium sp. TaxID=239 RepID=UPI0022C8FD85|nr:TlpA disulfide reductase family protein [Flavobacterium sp.]MCZ8330399.1 TlpA disulfide reductase family protein [Flavobacterium sp.]
MKKLLLFFIFFTEIVFSQKSTISGTIFGFKDGTEVLLGDDELGDIIQEAKINNNKFTFKNPSTFSPKRMYLIIKEDKTMHWFDSFMVDNQNVILSGDKSDIPKNIKIKGSKSNNEKIAFEKSYEQLQKKWDSINDLIGEKRNDTIKYSKEEINHDRIKRSKLDEQIENIKLNNIKSNPNSYISLVELFWLKEKIGKEEVKKLYGQLDEKLKQTDYGINLKVYLDLDKILQEGDYFHDFEAKDINGVLHKLSDYKGKYILLDFIQTYCFWCVSSNDDLKKINEKYKNELQIVTFCSDKSEKTWKNGYKEHDIKWVSLWNGEGLNGRINQLYGTEGTPTFILINPEGKITKKIFGFEEGKLEEILQKELNKK